jgi:hypothetical protein
MNFDDQRFAVRRQNPRAYHRDCHFAGWRVENRYVAHLEPVAAVISSGHRPARSGVTGWQASGALARCGNGFSGWTTRRSRSTGWGVCCGRAAGWRSPARRPIPKPRFLRIHRAILLNTDFIDEIHSWFGGRLLVRLKDALHTELTVARDRVRALKERLSF